MKRIVSILMLVAFVLVGLSAKSQCYTATYGLWPSATFTPTCNNTFANITTSGYAGEYSNVNLVAGNTYTFRSSVSTDYITVDNNGAAPLVGVVGVSGATGINWTCTVTGTYRFYTHTSSACGSATSIRTRSVKCTGSAPPAPSANCTNTTAFGSASINTAGTLVTISTCSYAGEYSTISGAVSGQSLRFTSSAVGDYITVRSGSSTGPVVGQGVTPLTFTNTFTGTLYVHWNTGTACGTQSSCRTTTVQCTSCTAPPAVANDNCSGASAIACGGTVTVNTTAASTDAAGASFCGTSISTAGVWYTVAGNGQSMVASTVGLTSTDTKIMVFSGSCAGLTCVGGNDDASGLQSSVSWNSVSGTTYYILAATYSGTGIFPMSLTCTTPVTNPCNATTALTCGVNTNYSIAGVGGAWNNLGGPYSTPGAETVFSYTPTQSGSYTINVSSSSVYVDLYYQAGSCGSTGWTYLNDIYSTAESSTVSLTGGVTYYFLLDAESIAAVSGTINISCYVPTIDPCSSITALSSCTGSSTSYSLPSGNGLWVLGPYSSVGQEKVFSFTPSVTASYPITVTNNSSGWVDLFWKVAGTCDGNGWTYVNDVFGTETSAITFTAGVTYYILLDDEDTGGSTGSIQIGCPDSDGDGVADNVDACPTVFGTLSNGCPCIGAAVDASYTYSAPISISGTTVDACDNSSLRAGYDRIYAITIPCAGSYTFSLCGGTTWDTYLTLSSASGSGLLAFNDDACSLQSSITYSVTTAGTYYIAVEPFSNGTTGSFTLNISGTGSVPSLTGVVSNATCNGASNGSINLSNGSASPSTYSWSNGATTEDISGVAAGTYTVIATNCWGTSTATFNVVEPAAIVVSTTSDIPGNAVCLEGEATLTGTATGGGGTLDYGWEAYDDASGQWISFTSAQGVAPISEELPTGPLYASSMYRFVATSATNANCSANAEIMIEVVDDPVLSVSTNNVSCFGGNDGSAVTEISGGVAGVSYAYNWTDNVLSLSTASDISGLAAGSYFVTAEGAYGCNASASADITEPTQLVASSSAPAILCNGGTSTVTVSATGGTAPYSWSEALYTVPAGNYTYTVTDGNGCVATTDVTVVEPTALSIQMGASDFNGYGVSCNGDANGSASATIGGGTPAYSYNWSNGGTGASIANLSAGTYNVTVTDANGCSISGSVTLAEPAAVTIATTQTEILCYGDLSEVKVITAGGVTPYAYDDAGTYNVPAGTYTYSITDANGCSASTTITITQPTQLLINAGGDEIVYYGYAPNACATLESAGNGGGTPGYSFSWSANGALVSAGNTYTACPSTSTVYTATVVDANGCIATDDVVVCAVDVTCTSGNSEIHKVQVCKTGKFGKQTTLCVDANAVPALLANGCTLGACNELQATCFSTSSKAMEIADEASTLPAVLSVYPNPTASTTTVSLTTMEAGEYTVEMYNVMGQKVMTVFSGTTDFENNTFELNMSSLESGIYMLGVSVGGEMVHNVRVVKN